MANHGPFDDDRYSHLPQVPINWAAAPGIAEKDQRALSTYSTGIRESSRALGNLLAWASREDAPPTLVLYFGDHLPALGANLSIYRGAHFVSEDPTAEELVKLYSPPFLIWSNRKVALPPESGSESFTGLGQRLAASAGLPFTPFAALTSATHERFPVFSRKVVLDQRRQPVSREVVLADDRGAMYWQAAYEAIFGENPSWEFFGVTEPALPK
jgi:hypothetical protein